MYERPQLPHLVFTDADGVTIPYGDRWSADGPPERTYSRTRHPERFAPLADVARALVAHLEATYDVDVDVADGLPTDAPGALHRYQHGEVRVVRTTTIVPRHSTGAPLVISETSFPTVVVAMGAAGLESAPTCACDACDESLEAAATGLENLVFAVAEGRYQERYTWTEGIEISIVGGDSSRMSREPRPAAKKERIDALKQSQRERHGERWMPWPVRAGEGAALGGVALGREAPVDSADAPGPVPLSRRRVDWDVSIEELVIEARARIRRKLKSF